MKRCTCITVREGVDVRGVCVCMCVCVGGGVIGSFSMLW